MGGERHRLENHRATGPHGVDLTQPGDEVVLQVVERIVDHHRQRVAEHGLGVAVVAIQDGRAADHRDARLGEGEAAGVDGLLTVADQQQAVGLPAPAGAQQLQPDAAEILDHARPGTADTRSPGTRRRPASSVFDRGLGDPHPFDALERAGEHALRGPRDGRPFRHLDAEQHVEPEGEARASAIALTASSTPGMNDVRS